MPTVLLVDPQGFLRAFDDFAGNEEHAPGNVLHWAKVLRGRT